ncbi:hypothetical protein KI387_027876, partial [Taxus chinensis]
MGRSSNLIQQWTPGFDPFKEKPDELPVWVKLPGLPMEFWENEILTAIANTLGLLVVFDHVTREEGEKSQYQKEVLNEEDLGLEDQDFSWGISVPQSPVKQLLSMLDTQEEKMTVPMEEVPCSFNLEKSKMEREEK